jgi:pyruvate,orthophosphate dikinase
MLETILNVGLCTSTIPTWEKRIGERTTWDSYRRLIQMFGDVVFNIPSEKYESILTNARKAENVATDAELPVTALKLIANIFLEITPEFPQSFKMQLRKAIAAVFGSWNTERAITYRNIHNLSHTMGTAVIAQSMVFGNFNDKSCTGVLFTRNPSTGVNKIHGEYLVNAQGEDVVAGIRTPLPLEKMEVWNPVVLAELVATVNKLEFTNKDMQDVEFTVQDGKLYILQTRNAKRTAIAAVKVATDLVVEGLIEKAEAFKRISYEQYCIAQKPIIDPEFATKPHGVGIPASSGFATGVVAFSSAKAVELAKTMPVILLAKETTPDDIAGMNAAVGIFTQTGGSSSHAAVVARGMDKVCVVGCLDLTPSLINIDGTVKSWSLGGATITEGVTSITIEGNTGNVWVGVDVPVIGAENSPAVALLNDWVGEVANYTEKVTSGTSGYLLTHNFDNDAAAFKKILHNFKGIVSLNTGKDMVSAWDSHLFELVMPFDDTQVKQNKIEAMLEVTTSGVSIDLDNLKLSTSVKNKLVKQGYELIPTINDLEGVVLSSGVVKFASEFKFTPAVNEVIGMKKQLGKSVESLVIIDSYDNTKNYGNARIVASKEVILKTLLK